MANEGFVRIAPQQVPLDSEGNSLVDLYVFLPTSNRYVRFIVSGEPIEEERTSLLESHTVKELYASETALERARAGLPSPNVDQVYFSRGDPREAMEVRIFRGGEAGLVPEQVKVSTIPAEAKGEVLGVTAQVELQKVYRQLMNPHLTDASMILSQLETKADEILVTVAPDTKDLKRHLISNLKYLGLMNDSAAITSLAVLIALAQGYDSKKSFRDLTLACLIMDSSLVEFTEEQLKQYYVDAGQLPPEIFNRIRKHPVKSYELAESKLKSISDGSMQLILNHHELFNGKGYPRGVRSEALFPMVKVLALAVDIFESIKRLVYMEQSISLTRILASFVEPDAEPHMRRHNRKLVDSLFKYLELNPQIVAAMDRRSEAEGDTEEG